MISLLYEDRYDTYSTVNDLHWPINGFADTSFHVFPIYWNCTHSYSRCFLSRLDPFHHIYGYNRIKSIRTFKRNAIFCLDIAFLFYHFTHQITLNVINSNYPIKLKFFQKHNFYFQPIIFKIRKIITCSQHPKTIQLNLIETLLIFRSLVHTEKTVKQEVTK